MSNIQLKGFFCQNFLVEKKISKSTPNDPKGEKKKRSPVKFGPPDGPAGRRIGKIGDLFSRFESLGVDLEKEFFNQNFSLSKS